MGHPHIHCFPKFPEIRYVGRVIGRGLDEPFLEEFGEAHRDVQERTQPGQAVTRFLSSQEKEF